jgi:hypothetical protein
MKLVRQSIEKGFIHVRFCVLFVLLYERAFQFPSQGDVAIRSAFKEACFTPPLPTRTAACLLSTGSAVRGSCGHGKCLLKGSRDERGNQPGLRQRERLVPTHVA